MDSSVVILQSNNQRSCPDNGYSELLSATGDPAVTGVLDESACSPRLANPNHRPWDGFGFCDRISA
jgi:hypothetical protein